MMKHTHVRVSKRTKEELEMMKNRYNRKSFDKLIYDLVAMSGGNLEEKQYIGKIKSALALTDLDDDITHLLLAMMRALYNEHYESARKILKRINTMIIDLDEGK